MTALEWKLYCLLVRVEAQCTEFGPSLPPALLADIQEAVEAMSNLHGIDLEGE